MVLAKEITNFNLVWLAFITSYGSPQRVLVDTEKKLNYSYLRQRRIAVRESFPQMAFSTFIYVNSVTAV